MARYPLIDIYCHIYPEKFFEEMTKVSPQTENLGKRLRTITKLFDLDARFREMDSFGDYRQIISLPNPPIEEIATGSTGARLARVGNDAMAELCAKHPDRFPGFVAAVSATDVESAVSEAGRAITELGACGIQMFTPLAQRLDVVEDIETPTVGGDHHVVAMHLDIAHRRRRQPLAERRPSRPVVEGNERPAFRPSVEQAGPHRVLAHDVDGVEPIPLVSPLTIDVQVFPPSIVR